MKNWYKGSYYMLYNIISKQENVPNYRFLTNCQKKCYLSRSWLLSLSLSLRRKVKYSKTMTNAPTPSTAKYSPGCLTVFRKNNL